MATGRRLRGWVLLTLALVVGGWLGHRWWDAESAGTDRLVNQLWIERRPVNDRDLVRSLVLVQQDRRRVGVAARASRWRLRADVLLWALEGDRLRARFPQDDRRLQARVRTWACEGEAPRPFELCLELRRNDRVLRLYSRKDWVVRPGARDQPGTELPWTRSLAAELTAAVDGVGLEVSVGEEPGSPSAELWLE